MADMQLGIRITADGAQANQTLNTLSSHLDKAGRSGQAAAGGLDRMRRSSESMSSALNVAKTALAGVAGYTSARAIYNTVVEFDRLNASLKTVTGSVAGATASMGMIRQFAAKTPYDIQQVTEAFIRLRSLGLDATEKSLRSYGNTAAAMGKPIMQFIEAVADASTNEFERLKEFGIKAKQEGENVTFTFQGVSTTVRKNSEEIQKYLLQMGNTQFSGGMVDQMETVGGAASNLEDAFSNLVDTLANLGIRDALKKGFAGASDFLNEFRQQLGELTGHTKENYRDALARRIEEQERIVESMQKGLFGSGLFVDTDEINRRLAEIESMETTLARLNQELSQSVSEGLGKAVEEGIQKAAPPKTNDIMQMVVETAKKYRVPEAFALAIAQTESGFNPDARSSAGAMGVMQLMAGTAKDLGVNAMEVTENIDGGMRYIKNLMERFNGDLRLVAAAYNAGPNRKSLAEGRVPAIKETQDYVRKVDAAYQQFLNKYPGGMLFVNARSQQQEYRDAEDRFKTHLDEIVAAAERAGKLEAAQRKTQLKAIVLAREEAEQAARQAIENAPDQEARLAAIERLKQAQMSAVQQAYQLTQQEIAGEMALLEVKREAASQELAHADQYQITITQRAQLQRELLDLENQRAIAAETRSQAEIAAAEASLKIQEEVNQLKSKGDQEDNVREALLRQNAIWDQTLDRMKTYAETWKKITGNTENAMADLSVLMVNYAKQIDQITAKYEELAKAKNLSEDDRLALQSQKYLETAESTLNMVAETALSMRSLYKEGTDGYNAMTAAAGAMEMAVMAINVVKGIQAVLQQLSEGDPYTAIPRALAVAAMVASMGIQTGAAANGGSTYTDQSGRNGGVFGDSEAQSDSIMKSLEIMRDNSSADLDYSRGMLRALESIENAMKGVTNAIILGVQPLALKLGGTTPFGADLESSMMRVIDPLGSALGFSKISSKITDWGLKDIPQKLMEILSEGFRGLNFTEVTKTVKLFTMTVSQSTKDVYGELNSEVSRQFTLTIRGIADALIKGGEIFGLTADDFNSRLANFVVDFGKLSTKDLKGAELQEAVTAMFSQLSDRMAMAFMPGLQDFQQVGEGYAETFFRVAEGISRATAQLDYFGIAAIDYTEIAQKQGDVAAEIVRQSLIRLEGANSTIGRYLDEVSGTSEELLKVYQNLLRIRDISETVGFNFAELNADLVLVAGGVKALLDSLEAYHEGFFTAGEQYTTNLRTLQDAFHRLGVAMPDSTRGFRELLEGIDQSTEKGRILYVQLLKLAEGFGALADESKRIDNLYNQYTNPNFSTQQQLEQFFADWEDIIAKRLADIEGQFDDELMATLQPLQDAKKAASLEAAGYAQAIAGATTAISSLVALMISTPSAAEAAGKAIESLSNSINAWSKKIKSLQADMRYYQEQIEAARQASNEALAAELEAEKARLIEQQGWALADLLVNIWTGIFNNIRNLAQSLEDQIANLQGSSAMAGLATQRRDAAFGAIDTYIAGIQAGGTRNVETEIQLIQQAQSAVMARYNAEYALIQEAHAAYVKAQTEAINDAMEAQIEAEQAALEARIDAINEALEAEIEALQAVHDEQAKALQKQHEAQLEALQEELEAANRLKQAIEQINDYVRGMALGGNSPLSPEQRLAEAQRQYSELLARANAGDVDALERLGSSSDAYLEAARNYYGSGTMYADIFDGVKNALTGIGGLTATDPDSIQEKIDQLREAQADEMEALRKVQQKAIEAIRDAAQDQIEQARKASEAVQEQIRDAAQDQIEAISDIDSNPELIALRESTIEELQKLQEYAALTQAEARKQAEEAYNLAMQEFQFSAEQTAYLKAIAEGFGFSIAAPAPEPEAAAQRIESRAPTRVESRQAEADEASARFLSEIKVEMQALVTTQSRANPEIIDKLTKMEERLAKMERIQRFNTGV